MREAEDPSRARRAELVLRGVESLPTLPSVAARLLRVGSIEDADLKEIVRLIEADPAMTARVLSLCRRAELGLSDRITTVERAVVMLGMEAVQAAVLSVQVVDTLVKAGGRPGGEAGGGEGTDAGFDRVGLWRHCIGVACGAELLCRVDGEGSAPGGRGVRPAEAFVAGLVHDLGKLALEMILPQAYRRVVELAAQRQCDIADCERQVLGLDHHTAGKRLAEHWQLPPALRDVMWLHGQRCDTLPEVAGKRLVALVGLADAVCRELHIGWSGNWGPAPAIGPVCERLGIDPARVEELLPALHGTVSERCKALGLAEESSPQMLLGSIMAANRRLGQLNATLERRSRAAHDQARALEAIREFHAGLADRRDPSEVVAAVLRSARTLLGDGFYMALHESEPGGPWLVVRLLEDGRRAAGELVDAPTSEGGAGEAGAAGLRGYVEPGALGGRTGLLDWLAEHVRTVPDPTALHLLRVEAGEGGVVVVLHDRGRGGTIASSAPCDAVHAAWAGALAAAGQNEEARRLGERLAEANRDLARMQGELAEAQSMARLGELTAGAAHEMNNPLAVISGRAQTLAMRVRDEGDRQAASAIVAAARRLSDLIARLNLIATPPEPRPEPVSAQDLVAGAVRQARERCAAAGGKANRTPPPSVRVTIADQTPAAHVDRDLAVRAVVEVVVNALESGSTETVEVRVRSSPGGGSLLVQVIDRGRGMSEHALAHAFDPFFSEKAAGRQAGLGLATARRLLELQGCSIELESRAGVGTVAAICLPVWRREPGARLDRAA